MAARRGVPRTECSVSCDTSEVPRFPLGTWAEATKQSPEARPPHPPQAPPDINQKRYGSLFVLIPLGFSCRLPLKQWLGKYCTIVYRYKHHVKDLLQTKVDPRILIFHQRLSQVDPTSTIFSKRTSKTSSDKGSISQPETHFLSGLAKHKTASLPPKWVWLKITQERDDAVLVHVSTYQASILVLFF